MIFISKESKIKAMAENGLTQEKQEYHSRLQKVLNHVPLAESEITDEEDVEESGSGYLSSSSEEDFLGFD